MIYSTLIGDISFPLQPLVSHAVTAAQVWETLASTYAKPSRGRIKQLRDQLKVWKKDNKSIDLYLQGDITRFDQFIILGNHGS